MPGNGGGDAKIKINEKYINSSSFSSEYPLSLGSEIRLIKCQNIYLLIVKQERNLDCDCAVFHFNEFL